MPTWNEFAWAACLYRAIGGDNAYQELLDQPEFLSNIRFHLDDLSIQEIKQKLIKGFLNRWKCRATNTLQSATAVRRILIQVKPYIQVLENFEIESVNFDMSIIVNNQNITINEAISNCYQIVRSIGYRFGATAVSKLLHIIQPKLFVMWDKDILSQYKDINKHISDSPEGYLAYLHYMQEMAQQVCQEFQNVALNPPVVVNHTVADYLSTQMNYNPPKTMAKYLDEYNWVTITNKIEVPLAWHP